MIPEIQTKIREWLPWALEEVGCDGPSLHFFGNECIFSAISAWRITFKNQLIVGSDDGQDEQVSEILKNAVIMQVVPQSSDFPVDPAFYFADGHKLEIFSDSSFDTWTFKIPTEPLYDFSIGEVQPMKVKNDGYFCEIQSLLPLNVERSVYDAGRLTLLGKNWSLTIKSSWRVVGNNNDFFGGAEEGGSVYIKEIKDIQIVATQVQSSDFPIDPVLFFSNGYRLELFTSTTHEGWKFQLPSGQMIVGGVQS